jgi:hypothetical protein
MPPCRSLCCSRPTRGCSAAVQSVDFGALLP